MSARLANLGIGYNKVGRDLNVNSMSNDERELYKKTITLLEEKVAALEEKLKSLPS